MSDFPCPCGGACVCHGSPGAFPAACSFPGGCGSVDSPASSEQLCVLGCADRTRADVWPRPPRPRVPGQLTCHACTDRIRTTLAEVLELAVSLNLVVAAGSAPAGGSGGGRKRIKDEPVAPVPVSIPTEALTDIRSRRGTWVPAAPSATPAPILDEAGDPLTIDQLQAAVDRDDRFLTQMIRRFGPRSGVAVTAASWLTFSQARLRAATGPRTTGPRSINPTDDDPASVVGFLDRWTDRVRIGRQLGAGTCPAYVTEYIQIRTGPRTSRFPDGMMQDWPHTAVCGRRTEYRRMIRIEMGARTTGLFAACPAGHVTRPVGQGDQELTVRAGHGHRPSSGARHGLTIFAAVNLLQTHNEWVCAQDWVAHYWRGLRELRAELGRVHGEQRPSRVGVCPNGTGAVDESTGREILCGQPLYASPYSDTIECPRCGRDWSHREWRFLGRTMGVIA